MPRWTGLDWLYLLHNYSWSALTCWSCCQSFIRLLGVQNGWLLAMACQQNAKVALWLAVWIISGLMLSFFMVVMNIILVLYLPSWSVIKIFLKLSNKLYWIIYQILYCREAKLLLKLDLHTEVPLCSLLDRKKESRWELNLDCCEIKVVNKSHK